MTFLTLLVNIAMAALLAATIAYCWTLNRRIQILQDSKSELAQLLKHFDESTARASESIIALQTASKKIGENIQQRVDKANYVLDDLALMLERGERLTEKLEADIAVSKARSRVGGSPVVPPPTEPSRPVEPLMQDEDIASSSLASGDKKRASLEAMLERVITRTKPAWPSVEKENAAPSRTRAEQELAEMLRVGIKG